jgi:hypothetical protein
MRWRVLPSAAGSWPHPHILNHLEKHTRSKRSSLFCLNIFSSSLMNQLTLLRGLPSLVGSQPHLHISNNLEKLSRSKRSSLFCLDIFSSSLTYAMERAPSSVGSQPHPHILNHLEKLSRSKRSSLFCLDEDKKNNFITLSSESGHQTEEAGVRGANVEDGGEAAKV